ncbi:organic solute transporter subunit alpha [Xenopus laevis]|uniref:Organic solute transporter subunit alpha n=2 Tax=Xenopus laevis TaxID=8355 RepID=A0A1L8HDE2_XENLA|nr:organic solute transporter subunit alpha [Xenopus laevis]OCT94117.1 hypothetical protein XELAEV_18011782mg [Xenopus laevis]
MDPQENATQPPVNPICRTRDAPYSYEILQSLDTTGILLFAMLTLMTLVTLLVFLEEAYYMYRKIPSHKYYLIIWINAGAMMISTTSCFGMWIPRSTMFTDFTASVFLAMLVHKFQLMLVNECGGRKEFLSKFGDTKLKISTGPFCCCCLCLPHTDINRRTLFILKLGTFQFAFLRPVLMFLAVVLWTNGNFVIGNSSLNNATMWINFAIAIMTITALWAVGVLFNLVKNTLNDQNIVPKFAVYQFTVILSQLQTAVINVLGTMGIIGCVPPLPGSSRASYMNQQLLIMEMFLVTVVCRVLYRRRYDEGENLIENLETNDNLQNSMVYVNPKALEDGPYST